MSDATERRPEAELLADDNRAVLARRQEGFRRAVKGSASFTKRSMLDFVDVRVEQLTRRLASMDVRDPVAVVLRDQLETLEILKRRIHNDVSGMAANALAAFEIYVHDGVIPPFGGLGAEARPPADQPRSAGSDRSWPPGGVTPMARAGHGHHGGANGAGR